MANENRSEQFPYTEHPATSAAMKVIRDQLAAERAERDCRAAGEKHLDALLAGLLAPRPTAEQRRARMAESGLPIPVGVWIAAGRPGDPIVYWAKRDAK